MEEIILFFMCFLFVFFIYQFVIVKRAKKNHIEKINDNWREPIEIMYLVKKYKIDLSKISYNQLLQIVALVSSLDISLVVSIIMLLDSFLMEIIIGFLSMIFIIFCSYHLVYLFYKWKGMICDE